MLWSAVGARPKVLKSLFLCGSRRRRRKREVRAVVNGPFFYDIWYFCIHITHTVTFYSFYFYFYFTLYGSLHVRRTGQETVPSPSVRVIWRDGPITEFEQRRTVHCCIKWDEVARRKAVSANHTKLYFHNHASIRKPIKPREKATQFKIQTTIIEALPKKVYYCKFFSPVSSLCLRGHMRFKRENKASWIVILPFEPKRRKFPDFDRTWHVKRFV